MGPAIERANPESAHAAIEPYGYGATGRAFATTEMRRCAPGFSRGHRENAEREAAEAEHAERQRPATEQDERGHCTVDRLVDDAYAYLTRRLRLDRDRHYLFSETNQAIVMFDNDVAERNGELYLTSVDVSQPGQGLGTQIIETIKAFAEQTGTDLYVGPCTNARYWRTSDGIHPDRHPWLTYTGDEHGEPVYQYQTASSLPTPVVISPNALLVPRPRQADEDRND